MPGAVRIEGAPFAGEIAERVKLQARRLKDRHGVVPRLAVVRAGGDPADARYVRMKAEKAAETGVDITDRQLGADCSQADVLTAIDQLNGDPWVHGILVQVPLPRTIDVGRVGRALDPVKDVDGFHPLNKGLLSAGRTVRAHVPCAPLGCLLLLRRTLGSLSGMNAVVIGRSDVIGKPMAQLLLLDDCTVTIAHSKSRDLPELCKAADILAAAAGKPGLVRGGWIKPGATVIDAAINRSYRQDGSWRVTGDVAFAEALETAGAVTPVPGGIGPMTIACLLANTVNAACFSLGETGFDWVSMK